MFSKQQKNKQTVNKKVKLDKKVSSLTRETNIGIKYLNLDTNKEKFANSHKIDNKIGFEIRKMVQRYEQFCQF